VLLVLCFASVASLKNVHIRESNSEFSELEIELHEVIRELQLRRAMEEMPVIYAKYNKNCKIDIEEAMCAVSGIGINFAICVGNEAQDIKTMGRVGAATDLVMSLATGPIWATLKGVGHLAQGNLLKAGDNLLAAGLEAVGDPTLLIRGIIAENVGNLDVLYMVCATCAMALAWAIANERYRLTENSAAELTDALDYSYTIKPTFISSVEVTKRKLCPMTDEAIDSIRRIAARASRSAFSPNSMQQSITGILAQIATNQVEATRNNVMHYFKAIASPLQAAFNEPFLVATETLENVMDPSTDDTTSKKRGGWMVEDLTDDYFDDTQDPVHYFTPGFKYRDCQRVCGDGALDVRGCARECRTCECTIS
jgi:hypothetical protein